MRKQVVIALVLTSVIVAIVLVWSFAYDLGYRSGYSDGAREVYNPTDVGSNSIQFTSEELQKFESIKSQLTVYNADSTFTGDRNLQWI